jgi:pectin methylesterase-like acyl-CoA thioesterase
LVGVEPLSKLLVPSQYPSIQAAIDAAADGAVVFVSQGQYAECVTIAGKRVGVVAAEGGEGEVLVCGISGSENPRICVSGAGTAEAEGVG